MISNKFHNLENIKIRKQKIKEKVQERKKVFVSDKHLLINIRH